MAVYTHLTHADIVELLTHYDIGTLVDFKGITEGVSNTNYLLITNHQSQITHYILTLFEQRTNIEDLPYFTTLMEWWSARGINCPQPIKMRDGRALSALKERPALIVSFLEGAGVEKITTEHMFQLGTLTAKMHLTGMDFSHRRANALSLSGWESLMHSITDRADDITPGLSELLRDEYHYLSERWPQTIPMGPVHADLFPDNVFFHKSFGKAPVLSGVIDFYFACHDAWAYDLAIVVNAWCFDTRHRLVPERIQALMHAYNEVRSFTPEEETAFPILLRGAALRFLLTRSYDLLNPTPGAEVTTKDPLEYVEKLRFFQTNPL